MLSLKTNADQESHTFKLHVFAYTAINLRNSVSLFSRITISGEEVQNLQQVCSNFFRATAQFLSSNPTSWAIGHVVPLHTKQLYDSIGMGLGVNTMEDREAKHIALANFTYNTKYSNSWAQVFKHEYISLFWLQENGCDDLLPKKTSTVYIPKRCHTNQFCHCEQPKNVEDENCKVCQILVIIILLLRYWSESNITERNMYRKDSCISPIVYKPHPQLSSMISRKKNKKSKKHSCQ